MSYKCTQVNCGALVQDGQMHSCFDSRRTLLPALTGVGSPLPQTAATSELQAMNIAQKAAEATGDAAQATYQRAVPTVAGAF